ncbi:MAG TPA: glycerol-3-phosphate dehydrogenase [Gammaproteobacteria bacterium]|nr:glycerol-3-phosphate dehydrogenase [Gammaproteobacteria bacterium]HJP37663.1 glycerol-3-phosphate dehydrogenase [Gammaproteobacteria bacterium]
MDFDLIIIGGGINGVGIARDAAGRGLRTCLLEQGDLSNGTTRWSSRLIHGGLRYLEHAELSLVYESLHERETLLKIAPHLVRPIKLLIPIFSGGRRGKFMITAGMWLYDLLSIGKSVPGHEMFTAREALEVLPALNRDGLLGAAAYYDAQVTFAERLVVENALAAQASGAQILTYSRVDRILYDARRIRGVRYTDLRTDRQYDLSSPVVVNASGPWVDRVLEKNVKPPIRLMGGTKGTHIIVPAIAGQPEVACYLEAESDGRPFFIIPWNGMLLIGTTDIRFDGNPGKVIAEDDEINYLLSETNHAFPDAHLERKNIHYHYTGVRPLPRKEKKAAGDVTRRHIIRHHRREARGLYSIIGGKLTTYRSLAEEMTDRVVRHLRHKGPECQTANEPLPGAVIKVSRVADELDACDLISPESRVHLLNVYGGHALLIKKLVTADPRLGDEICQYSHAIAAEIIFAYQHEFPTTLADVLLRRTMVGLSPDLGRSALPKALDIARHHVGWSTARADEEERRYLREISRLSD